MMATVQFAVTPQFSHLSFGDSAPVSVVVHEVLSCRNRIDNEVQDKILNAITKTGSTTVGDLRKLTDNEWKTLEGVPMICRIYLKHMVRQASRVPSSSSSSALPSLPGVGSPLTSSPSPSPSPPAPVDPLMASLCDDFNFGLPFDLSLYSASLNVLKGMGFGAHDSLEALCVTGNNSTELALEFLFQETATKKKRRAEQAEKQGRRGTGGGAVTAGAATGAVTAGAKKNAVAEAEAEKAKADLEATRTQLDRERASRLRAETDYREHVNSLPRFVYKELVRTFLSSSSSLVVATDHLSQYRSVNKLPLSVHTAVLSELGLTEAQLDNLIIQARRKEKEKAKTPGGPVFEPDCVICLAKPKSVVLLDCMHACLCDECSANLKSSGSGKQTCPVCNAAVREIRKVFI